MANPINGKEFQRGLVKFLVEEGATGTDIVTRLQRQFGENALSRSTIFLWIKRYKAEGRTTTRDKPHTGRRTSASTNANITTISNIIEQDRRVTVRQLCTRTNLSYGTIHRIIHHKLKLRKLCARWIPKLLSRQEKDNRVRMCRESLLRMNDVGEDAFFDGLITMDECWLPHFSPETKEESRQWLPRGSNPPLKV
jgi:transposase